MTRAASAQETISSAFSYHMDNIFTAIPAIVVNVRNDLRDMSLDVQPTINIKNQDGSVEERPIIMNVPFQFPSSSTSAFTFPINVGDSVLLVFSMRGLDAWKRGNGYPAAPLDFRKFDKRDCCAFPGLFPLSKSINDPAKRLWAHDTKDTVVVHNIGEGTETEIRLLASGGIVINTHQDVEVNCANATVTASSDITMTCANFSLDAASSISITSPSTSWTGAITQVGSYTQSGIYTLDAITMNTHVHPILSGSSAPGPTGAPQ